MGVMIVSGDTLWTCPNCPVTDLTHEPKANRYHQCRGLRGLLAPLVPAGTKCKVVAIEREDYVGREHVQVDATGRPVMSVVTTRDNGQDAMVFAPRASADSREYR